MLIQVLSLKLHFVINEVGVNISSMVVGFASHPLQSINMPYMEI